jgi:type I restriction enzyme R subunit
LKKAAEELTNTACEPFDKPEFRNTLVEIKKKTEQTIDTVSKDEVILAAFDQQAKEKAQSVVESFRKFIEDNKDEITALQLIYSKPFGQRHITYEQIDELAKAIKKPPLNLRQETLWLAYEQLEKAKVKRARADKLLTDIISLIRFAIAEADTLEPFGDVEDRRFRDWLTEQQRLGRTFTPEQMEWLTMIKDHIATSLQIGTEDFEYAPFHERGGAVRAYQLFGDELSTVLEELNEALAA